MSLAGSCTPGTVVKEGLFAPSERLLTSGRGPPECNSGGGERLPSWKAKTYFPWISSRISRALCTALARWLILFFVSGGRSAMVFPYSCR